MQTTHDVFTMVELDRIPGPPALPFLGNVRDIDLKNSIQSFLELADTYGRNALFEVIDFHSENTNRSDFEN